MRVYAKLGSLNFVGLTPIPNLDLYADSMAELAMLSAADGDRHIERIDKIESFAEITRLLGTYAPPFGYFGFSEDERCRTSLGFYLKPSPHVLAIQAGVPVVDDQGSRSSEEYPGFRNALVLADDGYGSWDLYWIGEKVVPLWNDSREWVNPGDPVVRCEDMPDDVTSRIPPLQFGYVNYRGDFGDRNVQPIEIGWRSSPHHLDPGYVLTAHDLDKGAVRHFLMRDIVTPFYDAPRGERLPPLGMGDALKRGDVLRCIDDHGTLEKIWSAP